MLDIKYIRNNLETVTEGLARRGIGFDAATFRRLDEQRRDAETQMQQLLAERKQASKEIGKLVKEGVPVEEAKSRVEQSLARIEEQLDTLKESARSAQESMDAFLLATPNLPADDVPPGDSDDDNIEVLKWGEPPAFDFEPADHVDVAERLGLIDFDTAAKLTGSRFVVLKGPLARLHRALIQFMLDLHTGEHGYTEVNVPYIVNADSLLGTGQLPKFAEDLFRLEGEHGYYLIPTAEVPVTNLLRDEIAEALPLRFAAHTPCFRSEAGSYGRDTRGMIRQHQFEKVELVQFVTPADSDTALEALTGHAEAVLQKLGLAYRKVVLCGGDLGFSARKTYDLEVWLPGQRRYREISSCSNFGDFQARRMRARWRNTETGKPEYLHTLNGSGLAVGRTLVALLENCQRADGSVSIPQALQPYMGGAETL